MEIETRPTELVAIVARWLGDVDRLPGGAIVDVNGADGCLRKRIFGVVRLRLVVGRVVGKDDDVFPTNRSLFDRAVGVHL